MTELTLLTGIFALMTPQLPARFDLRSVEEKNWVTAVKKQQGGTCWTHSTMASIEGNLLLTGAWEASGESGEPNLAEYHLDWWNGFNKHNNPDIAPTAAGLSVHQGGDYLVAAAYLSRGPGAVRDQDGQSYSSPPPLQAPHFHPYYVRDIEWLTAADPNESQVRIKLALMKSGVVGTALAWTSSLYSASKNSFYQPTSHSAEPNHAVAIVGWDDQKITQASKPGAWLIKNSWGTSWGQGGYFWISYYDKVAGRDPNMGAVSFSNVEPHHYRRIYGYDTHGWRATKSSAIAAFNAFTPLEDETLSAVSFYTTVHNSSYRIVVYDDFDGTSLSNAFLEQEGTQDNLGLHTVKLHRPVSLRAGDPFYVSIELPAGGHAFDKTSVVAVLLGSLEKPIVESRALSGESYYLAEGQWVDLTREEPTANFCIKALMD